MYCTYSAILLAESIEVALNTFLLRCSVLYYDTKKDALSKTLVTCGVSEVMLILTHFYELYPALAYCDTVLLRYNEVNI